MKIILSILILSSFALSDNMITPIPQKLDYDNQKAILGKKLFFDKRLSSKNNYSCATCHHLNEGGDDNLIGTIGNDGKVIPRNSPTVYNSIFNETQHWDGSIKNLKVQALNSITHPLAMNSNFKEIILKLNKDKYYSKTIKKLYNSKISEENILHAIVEFEKTLITPNSQFDKYLKGDKNALNKKQKEGYKLFKEYGCISCHNGINIGGNLLQKIGVLKTYKTNDFGRYFKTNLVEDMYYFKVPTLRNIELTAPYFHDGKVKTLKEAVKLMIDFQIGFELNEHDILCILEFLKTLTGEIPAPLVDKNE